jgi:hypothetical protein
MIGTTSRVARVEHIEDGTSGGRDVYIDDYGRRWIKTNYTKETSPTGVLVGYIQSDGSIYMFDQTLNGAQTVHILICESRDLTIQTLSSVMVSSSWILQDRNSI